MKRFSRAIASFASLLTLGAVVGISQPSIADSETFYCKESSDGTPTTFMARKYGASDLEIIRWSQAWSEEYTPEKRCEIVSANFHQAYKDGNLKYIIPAYLNGYPIVCGTSALGGSCNAVLFTLRSDADPEETIEGIMAVGTYSSSAIEQSTGEERQYYDFNAAFGLE